MRSKLLGLRSFVAAAAVAAVAAPAVHAASGIGNPVSPAATTPGQSGSALTAGQCAALPASSRTPIGACPQEREAGVSVVETDRTEQGRAHHRAGRPEADANALAARRVAQGTALAPPDRPVLDNFDWVDAGIGAGAGIAALLAALAGVSVARSRRLARS
jgi:hypothetical protein